jgi:D-3-phosphoglycerate dehydrogenase
MADLLVTEAIAGPELDALRRDFDVVVEPDLWKEPGRLQAALADARALLVRNQTRVTAEVIRASRRLELVGRAGVGLDNVDVRAASDAGVVVSFAPDQSASSVAELAFGMMLSLARLLLVADQDTRAGGWNRARFVGTELWGKTLGLVGCGRIGYRTGVRARAFGMDVVVHDPYLDPASLYVSELGARLVSLDELLATSDFVSCHLPETAETRGLMSYERLCAMKREAFFVNTARGGVVDEPGLARALREGRLAGAGLDVRAVEPPSAPGELATLPNVLLTPHVGAFTREAQVRVVAAVCRDVRAVLSGEPARNFANFSRPRTKETAP